jgi:uncharacterized protein (TIGR02594 family)
VIDRRQFLLTRALPFTLMLSEADGLRGQLRPGSEDYRDFESPELPNYRPLGTDPATPDEVAKADRLILASPSRRSPLEVMKYLESLEERNVDNEPYNGGWRNRWNPVIVRFFAETKTKPAGDTTAWCAASLNWVLGRSGFSTTQSASSGSFRESPGLIIPSNSPAEGDIVVFGSTDPDQFKVGRGHVGLFLDQNSEAVLVLGGNQKNTYGHHSLCRKWIKKDGVALKLHSFHAVAAFRQKK